MADDDLDLSEFEEYSSTAAAAGTGSGGEGNRPAGGSSRKRRWPWFLAGLLLGAAAAVFGPDLAAPYLPDVLRPGLEEARGPVLGKRIEGERLLLTVDTERGAVLATFRQRVPEIDLLVEEGDTVILGLREYAPLVEDPVLQGVRKGGPGRDAAVDTTGGPPEGAPEPAPGPGSDASSPDPAPGGAADSAGGGGLRGLLRPAGTSDPAPASGPRRVVGRILVTGCL